MIGMHHIIHIPSQTIVWRTQRKEKTHMNKLFNKIAVAFVGMAMAIGVGVAVGGSKGVVPAHATDPVTNTVTFTMAGFNEDATSYDSTDHAGTGAITGGGTINAVARNFNTSTGAIRGNQTSVASNWSLWNTQAIPGPITTISLTATGTLQNNLYAATGTSTQASATTGTAGGTSPRFTWSFNANSNLTYFKLCTKEKFTSGTVTAAVVTVTYEVRYSVTYDKNGGTGTMTDSSSPYASGATVTVLGNSFTAPSGYQFDHWDTKADDSGTDYAPGATFSISANTTLYAQWAELSDDPYVIVTTPISGYTGQEPDVSFQFGNFTSSLSIVSSDEDVVEISDVDTTDPSNSTVTLSYVGAGSASVYFKDGSTTIATLAVTVTQTTLSLNKASTSIAQQDSETLTATTNVGGATWTVTGNAKVHVDDGVVSVDSDAVVGSTATITAKSDVDDSVSASCTVTVLKAVVYNKITDVSKLYDGQKVLITKGTDQICQNFGDDSKNDRVANVALGELDDDSKIPQSKVTSLSAAAYTIGRYKIGDDTVYTLKDENGKYLYNNNTSSNTISTVTTLVDNYVYWNIEYNSTNDNFDVTNYANSTKGVLCFNGTIFRCYGSLGSYVSPSFYALDSEASPASVAESFKQNALHFKDYDSSKATEGTSDGAGWCSNDNEHKYYFYAKRVWNAMSDSERAAADADTLARLGAWASANGDSLVGTNVLSAAKMPGTIANFSKESSAATVIIIISVVSIVAAGGYLVLRKRKEN